MKTNLIIITGLPATGKTTLGEKLSVEFHLPFISKDVIKEIFFDALETTTRDWSKKIGAGSYDTLFYLIEENLKSGYSMIIESNFKKDQHTKIFKAYQKQYNCNILQILCGAEGEIVCKRFIGRVNSGERHLGHDDAYVYSFYKEELMKGWCDTLDLGDAVLKVDTTDYKKVNYQRISTEVGLFLQ